MSTPVQPTFGKRGAPLRAAPRAPAPAAPDHNAFFAAVRAELAEAGERETIFVPFSYKAACLAGLVVGCALAGFDVHGQAGAQELDRVAQVLGLPIDTSRMTPALIALGLFGGARVATFSAILVHAILRRIGLTSRLAYAAGGTVAAALLAEALILAIDHPPPHGWAVELFSGAAAGFLYRVIAGARRAIS